MAFWGIEVKPGKPYTHHHDSVRGRLRLSQATMGDGKGAVVAGARCLLQCNVGEKSPVLLCSLIPNVFETSHLELEFEEGEDVVFSVLGPRSIHLSGYYVSSVKHDGDETDSYGEDIGQTDSEDEEFGFGSEDYDEYESDFIDDDDEIVPSKPRKSGVVIEEILEDENLANGDAGNTRSRRKNQVSDSDDDLPLVAKPALPPVVESEDEDGFPMFTAASDKATKGSTDVKLESKSKTSEEGKKRKGNAVNEKPDSDRKMEMNSTDKAENTSRKKIKTKERETADSDLKVDAGSKSGKSESGDADADLGEIPKPEEVPAEIIETESAKKAKKNKKKKKSKEDANKAKDLQVKEGSDDQNAEENNAIVSNDASQQETKKKKKKSQNESNKSQEVPPAVTGKKEPLQTRTFPNGMIIEELEMGKPDGKKASPGSRVFVNYIGKLKNGSIFDSNVGQRPFKFRLGVGQVIKGWDVGVSGMRIGDKRRLTIPPAMGYGDKAVGGKIPKNSWLTFDVELVDVK